MTTTVHHWSRQDSNRSLEDAIHDISAEAERINMRIIAIVPTRYVDRRTQGEAWLDAADIITQGS